MTELVARGIEVAPVILHTGVASLELGERPYPERFRVPVSTAERVNLARANGGRVVAVGTTVVRALESAAGEDGRVRAADGGPPSSSSRAEASGPSTACAPASTTPTPRTSSCWKRSPVLPRSALLPQRCAGPT